MIRRRGEGCERHQRKGGEDKGDVEGEGKAGRKTKEKGRK